MKKFHKSFISLILVSLACVAILGAAESVTRIYLSPDETAVPLATVTGHSEELTNVASIADASLNAQGWQTATWAGPTKGYALEGSATKQLILPAGIIVYQTPSLEGNVITMVDSTDERDENFRVVSVEGNWEVVEFTKPISVYVKTTAHSAQHAASESAASNVSDVTSTHTVQLVPEENSLNTGSDIVDLESEANWVVASSDGSGHSWKTGMTEVQSEGTATSAGEVHVTETAAANTDENMFDGNVVEAVEIAPDGAVKATDFVAGDEILDGSEETCEPTVTEPQVMRKRVLPPIDQDPLVRRCAAPAASANRQLSGKLVKSSLLCSMMEHNNQYELRDDRNRTLAYLDLCEVNDVCHYLNRCVVVQGPVCCKRPSAPLTMKVKLIRIVR